MHQASEFLNRTVCFNKMNSDDKKKLHVKIMLFMNNTDEIAIGLYNTIKSATPN